MNGSGADKYIFLFIALFLSLYKVITARCGKRTGLHNHTAISVQSFPKRFKILYTFRSLTP